MNKLLGLLLIIILFIIGYELFFLLQIKPQIKTTNNIKPYPTKTTTNTKIDREPWVPSEIRTYKNETYGLISSALVKVNKTTSGTIEAELKDKNIINFLYDQNTEYFDRKETQQTLVEQKRNLKGFSVETGKIYLVEWLGNPKKNNKLWRISRLVL